MIRALISGTPQKVLRDSINIDNAIEERTTATFVINDPDNIQSFVKGQPVTLGLFADIQTLKNFNGFGNISFGNGIFTGGIVPIPTQIYFSGVIENIEKKVFPAKTYPSPQPPPPILDTNSIFGNAPFGFAPFSGGYYLDPVFPSGETEKAFSQYIVTCIDYHYAADKRLAAKSYVNETVENIVTDLFETYLESEGIKIGQIDSGVVIQEAVFNYVSVSQCLDAIADRSGYWWRIDEEKKLQFLRRGSNIAPWILRGQWCKADSILLQDTAPKFRNQQVIKGSRDITSVQTETFKGNGEQQSFTVGFPIAKVPTVEISTDGGTTWIAQNMGIKGVSEGKDWYWSSGDPTITQDIANIPLTETDLIRVHFQGEFPVIVISRDTASILDRQKVEQSGTGIVEDTFSQSETVTRESVFQLAGQLLAKYGTIGIKLNFITRREGLLPGQLLTVDLPDYRLNTQMLITNVSIYTESKNVIWYQVTAIEGPEIKSWAQMFSEMVKRTDSTVRVGLGVGEIIIIPYQFEKDWLESEEPNIFYEVYPFETLTPSDTLFPAFDDEYKVRFLEWEDDAGNKTRKTITQVTGENTDEIFSITYLAPNDATGTITSFSWIGGIDATIDTNTGIKIDEQMETISGLLAPWNKTPAEGWQVEKTDRRWS